MIYSGQGVRLGKGLAVGFSDTGVPVVEGSTNGNPPPPEAVLTAINQRMSVLIGELSLLHTWLMAAQKGEQQSRIIVPQMAVPPNLTRKP